MMWERMCMIYLQETVSMSNFLQMIIAALLALIGWGGKMAFKYFKGEWERHTNEERQYRLDTNTKIQSITDNMQKVSADLTTSVDRLIEMTGEEISKMKERLSKVEDSIISINKILKRRK